MADCAAAEGDRKAYYEVTQNTIRLNKEILAQCKRENKDLRNALAAVQRVRKPSYAPATVRVRGKELVLSRMGTRAQATQTWTD
jgi:hypothetical protein